MEVRGTVETAVGGCSVVALGVASRRTCARPIANGPSRIPEAMATDYVLPEACNLIVQQERSIGDGVDLP